VGRESRSGQGGVVGREARAAVRDRASAALDAQRWTEAEQLYESLCVGDEACAADWAELGRIHGLRGEMARAETCFREALRRDPRNVEALCNLGVVHETRGEPGWAIARYRAALALDPGRVEIQRNLASLLCDGGFLEETRAIAGTLRGAPGRWPLEADVLQARIYEHEVQPEAAIAGYTAVLSRDPGHVEARLRLANLLLSLWRCEEALPHFRELARRQAGDASVRNNLGVTLARLGRLTAAETAWAQALAMDPGHAGARENREKIREQLWAYDQWFTAHQTLIDPDRAAVRRRIAEFQYRPTISLLLPVRDGHPGRLIRALEAIRSQLYEQWELCVVPSADVAGNMLTALDEFATREPRVRRSEPVSSRSRAELTGAALGLARGEYVAVLGEHDEISEQALYLFVEEINRVPGAALIYGDEDRIDDDQRRFDPWFRPGWNPDLLLSQNYIGRFACARSAAVRAAGGLDVRREGLDDWSLWLRLTAGADSAAVRHLAFVLYHRRVDADGDEPGAIPADPERAAAMLEEHLAANGTPVRVTGTSVPAWRIRWPVPDPAPLVTIVIPTRDRRDLLQACVESIFGRTRYVNFELLIVDNQSSRPDALDYLRQLSADPRVRVIPYDAPFNYSAICNRAVEAARGDVVVLLNNDTEVISYDWLDDLVGHALRPEVGIVGAMLYYPDDTIQHAGIDSVPLAEGGLHHRRVGEPRGYRDSRARAWAAQNLIAVTGACQAMRKSVYEELGGMDQEHLVVAYNDVELCLKAQARGYRIVWTPWAELYHHESATTGDRTRQPQERERGQRELDQIRSRWARQLDADRAVNPNVARDQARYGLAWPPRIARPWEIVEQATGSLKAGGGADPTAVIATRNGRAPDQGGRNDLERYFLRNPGRMIDKWWHYFEIYDRHFSRFRGKPINVVEVGVYQGGSLQMWKSYFGEHARIVGIDLNPLCEQFEEERITVLTGDQADPQFLRTVAQSVSPIHILIDDGGHTMRQQHTTFEVLYPAIAEDGVYLCEDLHTSFWPEYGAKANGGSFLEFSKTLIDRLTAWHARPSYGPRPDAFTRSAYAMHYYDSVLVIEKRRMSAPARKVTGIRSIPDDSFPPPVV